MQTQIINRLSFETFNQVIGNPLWSDFTFDMKALRKHGQRGLPHKLKDAMDMARKAKSNGRTDGNSQGVTWCNVTIEPHHEHEISQRGIDDVTLLAAILECVGQGYTFGFKPASDGDGYMAYFIAPPSDPVNGGLGLAAFAGDERDAMLGLVFKHFTIADGTWPRAAGSGERRFR